MQSDIVLSSRVRLARNYADLPFDLASEPEQAETCILRTLSALRQAGLEEQYDLLRLRDMSDVSRRAMEESHLVSRDLLRSPETAAVLVKRDSSVSIMMNEDDHLRIQAVRTGMICSARHRRVSVSTTRFRGRTSSRSTSSLAT